MNRIFILALTLTLTSCAPARSPSPSSSPSPITAPFNSISNELDELRREIETIKRNKSKLTEGEAIAQPEVVPIETGAEASIVTVPGKDATQKAGKPYNYNYLRVEVINVSGMAGLGDAVAAMLKKGGFNIVQVDSLEVSNNRKSFILHKKKFINEGVMVAREIPKDQDVLISKRLSSKVDVRVVVGKDLEFIMNK